MPVSYDVFLSHNSADKPAVLELGRRLKTEAINAWIDTELIPGQSWQADLEAALKGCSSCAVFFGPSGFGDWQKVEMTAAIELQAREPHRFRVIPVLLPGVTRDHALETLPLFLSANTWVQFPTLDDQRAFQRLIWGIKGTIHGELLFDEPRKTTISARFGPSGAPSVQDQKQLRVLLEKVRQDWIEGILKNSIHHEALIALGMEANASAVEHPWEQVMALPHLEGQRLPPGKRIIEVFEEIQGFLLILGEPGSGKTTTLLELASILLERAEKECGEAIPVVFNLSSWRRENRSLLEWLVEELASKYRVPKPVGRAWLEKNRLIPLLDGLDEVKSDEQSACVQAINEYMDQGLLSALAVCSRLREYQSLSCRLRLNGAVCLQALTPEQVDEYLARAGSGLAGLRTALRTDEVLVDLTESPLMLNIMSLAYQHAEAKDLTTTGSLEQRRQQIFALYVEKMLRRKGRDQAYSAEQNVISWLSWLARKMKENSLSVFLVEEMQPNWLSSSRERRIYGLLAATIGAMAFGISSAPVFGFVAGLLPHLAQKLPWGVRSALLDMLFHGLFDGLVLALVFGAFAGLFAVFSQIRTVEIIDLSWHAFRLAQRQHIVGGLFVGLIVTFLGMRLGLPFGDYCWGAIDWLDSRLFGAGLVHLFNKVSGSGNVIGMVGLLFGTTVVGAIGGMLSSFVVGLFGSIAGSVDSRPERMRNALAGRSERVFLKNGALAGLLGGLVIGLLWASRPPGGKFFCGLVGGMFAGVVFWMLTGVDTMAQQSGEIANKTFPNQGIRASLVNGVLLGVAGGLAIGLLGMITFGLVGGWVLGIMEGVVLGLLFGLFGLFGGGGNAVLLHLALRLVLARQGYAPLAYVRFLDHCAKLILLKKVGGGFIFIHRMLLDYFAHLESSSPAAGRTRQESRRAR